jgi:hypothetical protein
MRRKAHKGVKRFRTKLLALEISFCVYQRINKNEKYTPVSFIARRAAPRFLYDSTAARGEEMRLEKG